MISVQSQKKEDKEVKVTKEQLVQIIAEEIEKTLVTEIFGLDKKSRMKKMLNKCCLSSIKKFSNCISFEVFMWLLCTRFRHVFSFLKNV